MELMVAMAVGLVVLSGVLVLVQVVAKNEARVSAHVLANQRARPVMTRLIDLLHSGCVAPGVAPVLPASSDTSLGLISKSGSAVNPTPDKHIISLTGSTLNESIYAATGGASPSWTFAASPYSSRALLSGVTLGSTGSPSTTVPLFRYYAYAGGQVSPTPLPTPLSQTDATRTVKVEVAFATAPKSTPSMDPKAPITLSDSVALRLEPASEDANEVNLPCV
jgi:hypothetical protein